MNDARPLNNIAQELPAEKPSVRPGRVDDLVLAMLDKLAEGWAPGYRYMIAFVRPQLEPLVRRHLRKVRLPGAPVPATTRIRKRRTVNVGPIRPGGVEC